MPPVRRHVARALLLDPANRVLLLPMPSDLDPNGEGYWYLPGGGIEVSEAPIDAVRREIREELGLDVDLLDPAVVHLVGVRFEFGGRTIEQDEWHFLARTSVAAIGHGRAGDPEQRAVLAHRWWSLDELTSTSETVFPTFLGALTAELISSGPPATTRELRSESHAQSRRNKSRDGRPGPTSAGPTRRNPAAS